MGSSADGLVKVVVDGSGEPTVVTRGAGAMRSGGDALGDAFIAATRAALGDLRTQIAALVQQQMTDDMVGPAPSAPHDAVRQVTRQAEQAMDNFDDVRRRLMDRLPEP